MDPASDSTLTSLAMLSVNRDELGTDYLDYFVPFANSVLVGFDLKVVTDFQLKEALLEEFGLQIPHSICNIILQRLARAKILTRENELYRVANKSRSPEFESKRSKAQQSVTGIVDKLVTYSVSRLKEPLTQDTAAMGLGVFLQRFSVEFLRSATQNTALPEMGEVSDASLALVSSFIRNAALNEKGLFDEIVQMVQGHMLANALLCPDIGSSKQKFRNVTFYFDTPLILSALDLHDDARCNAVRELLSLIKKLNGAVAVFSHTFDETTNVLRAAIEGYDQPRSKMRAITEAKRLGRRKSDLVRTMGQLSDKLGKLGISVLSTPNYEAAFQIDESVLGSALEEDITYANPDALPRDISSVRSIYALRRGRTPTRLEDCGAVLVTSNSAFARAAYAHGATHEYSRNVSPVITDFALANLAWLKSPLEAPNVPRLELLANCYAAMAPKEELWRKYIQEVDRLRECEDITPDDHAILRTHLEAHENLVYLTDGGDQNFHGATVLEVLDRIKSGLTKAKDKELSDLAHEKESVESRLAFESEKNRRLERKIKAFGNIVAAVPVVIAGVVVVIAVVISFGFWTLSADKIWIKTMWRTLLAVGVVIGALSTVFGYVPITHARKLHSRLSEVVYSKVRSWLVDN